MDAFQAPFKLEYSFWIGLQLLMRIILYVLVIFVPEHRQLYCVDIVVVIILIAQTTFSPYKPISFPKFPDFRNFLDNIFLFLLLAHIIEVLSLRSVSVLGIICYTVALILYVGLLLYYVFKRFPRLRRWVTVLKTCWFRQKQNSTRDLHSNLNSDMEENDDNVQVAFYKSIRSAYPDVASSSINIDYNCEIPEAANYTELRESLLKTDY